MGGGGYEQFTELKFLYRGKSKNTKYLKKYLYVGIWKNYGKILQVWCWGVKVEVSGEKSGAKNECKKKIGINISGWKKMLEKNLGWKNWGYKFGSPLRQVVVCDRGEGNLTPDEGGSNFASGKGGSDLTPKLVRAGSYSIYSHPIPLTVTDLWERPRFTSEFLFGLPFFDLPPLPPLTLKPLLLTRMRYWH